MDKPIFQQIMNYRLICPKSILFRKGKKCELCQNKKIYYPSIYYLCYNNSFFGSLIFAVSFYIHYHVLKSFDLVDYFLFSSQFTKEYILRSTKIPKNKAVHLPTFTFPQSNIKNKPTIVNKKYFVYAGRLSEEKGIKELINIFISSKSEIILYVIGDGPLKKYVQLSANNNKKIIYKGSMKRLKLFSFIRGAKATIVPSIWHDVQPHVVLESLAVGTLVIAPNTRVFSELINNKINGFLYSNYFQLERLLNLIWDNDNLINKNTIKDSCHVFSPERHYSLLQGLYKRSLHTIKDKSK